MSTYVSVVIYSLSGLINIIGVMANSLQTIIAIGKKQNHIKVYSVLLVNSGICDMMACLSVFFVQQRQISKGTSLFFIPNGVCKTFGGNICHLSYSISLHCYSHNLWSLLICFLYRHLAIISVKFTRIQMISVISLAYFLSLFQLVLFFKAITNSLEISKYFREEFPEYIVDESLLFGTKNIFDSTFIFVALHISLPILPIYCVIFFCRKSSMKFLKNTKVMSTKTTILHRKLLHALTYQAVLPSVYIFALFLYSISALDISHNSFLEFLTPFVQGLVSALSPVVRLFYIPTYRDWIKLKILKKYSPSSQVVFSVT